MSGSDPKPEEFFAVFRSCPGEQRSLLPLEKAQDQAKEMAAKETMNKFFVMRSVCEFSADPVNINVRPVNNPTK